MPFEYTPNDWESSNIITKEALNKLEQVGTYVSNLNEIAETGDYKDLTNVPTKLSEFENDTDFQTLDEVNNLIGQIEVGEGSKWYNGSALIGTSTQLEYSSPSLTDKTISPIKYGS